VTAFDPEAVTIAVQRAEIAQARRVVAEQRIGLAAIATRLMAHGDPEVRRAAVSLTHATSQLEQITGAVPGKRVQCVGSRGPDGDVIQLSRARIERHAGPPRDLIDISAVHDSERK
jgi:hypothetical protein